MSRATRGSLSLASSLRALSCAVLAGMVLLSFATVAAHATGIPTNLQATVTGTDGTSDWTWRPTLNADASSKGDFWVTAPDQENETFSLENIQLHGNVDPVINGGFLVTNLTAAVQNYTFIFTIPIIAQTPLTVTGGSTTLGVTDNNANGATVGPNANGRPYYYSQIDLVDWQSINLVPLVAGPFSSAGTSGDFGQPIPSLPGPAALSFIGIRYDFSLTPGDSASATGVFVVEAIPEPATCFLALAGLVVCGTMRRRS
jgi:hypothetical protein